MASSLLSFLALASVACSLQAASISQSTVPEQIHLAHGDSSGTKMTVSWITPSDTFSTVTYRMGKGTWQFAESKNSSRYTFQSAYKKTLYTSGAIHHVTITDLLPGCDYEYRCGDGITWSDVFTFSTPPQVGPTQEYRFGIMGDLGQTNNSAETVKEVIAGGYDTVLLVGDLSYADSAWEDGKYGPCDPARWDSWGKMVQPLTANTPLMVLPGNHEVEQEGPPPATQTEFLAYEKRMKMPSEASGGNGSLYYSFEIASAHFVMLNSYMDFNVSSPQYNWLKSDLAKVDRSKTPWLIVNMHAPWYNSNVKHHDEEQETGMRAAMEPLLLDAKVDLVMAGHVHAYERMYNVAYNKTKAGAPIYVNIGDAGNREGPCPDYLQQPSWSAFRESAYGHGEIHIYNSTHLKWEWKRMLDKPEYSADSVMIVKDSTTGHVHAESRVTGQVDGYALKKHQSPFGSHSVKDL
eukprot:m.7800 g.7800  ORF g.7800 m.7800 type:complete len:463 (-) comp3776_c0_seq1:2950-4338(-)